MKASGKKSKFTIQVTLSVDETEVQSEFEIKGFSVNA